MPAANPEKIKVAKELSRKEIVFALARFPGSARLAFGGSDFKVYDIDLSESKPEAREFGSHDSYVTGLTLAGPSLISGAYDGRLIWWNPESRSQVRSVPAHAKWIRAVESTSDGAVAASVADDMVCRLWDAASGRLIHELKGHAEKTPHHYPSMLYACAFTPDGRHVATGDKVGLINVWEVESGKKVASVEAPVMYTWDPVQRRHSIGGIRTLAFSPDGTHLAVGGIGKINNIDHLDGKARVEVFDWQKGERSHEFPGDKFNGLVERLVFHPSGDWLLAAGGANDGFITFFDLAGKKIVAQEKVPMHVHDVALNDEADTVYAVGDKKIAVLGMGS
jgi:WD40 repeat protein